MPIVLDGNEFTTTGVAARALQVSATRIRQLGLAGRLPIAAQTPLGTLYRRADVDRLARERAALRGEQTQEPA